MNKTVLVMDMPESCLDCQFCIELDEGIEAICGLVADQYDDSLFREIDGDYCQDKPHWCPLKPMPDKFVFNSLINGTYEEGWNACIDEISKN